MAHREFDTTGLTEIDSVGSFIREVKKLRESVDGTSTEFYFRGQEVEFWDVEPSIFRNDMLSIEHKLMQIPLQRIPMEFKEYDTMFDIMTKYQHYGMCTRLLDLTTNPLVALYFACKIHGNEEYDADGEIINKEPYGVIYYTNKYYPSRPSDKEIRIVSALASYDLSKANTISEVLDWLKYEGLIDEDTKNRWLRNEYFCEFVKIIQSNYMVIPTYSNERLRKQSGVFLLSSLFSIDKGIDIGKSTISKSKGDLRMEFSETFFYISGENKESILKELDIYNINEATLFPELEHQLSHIRRINENYVQVVGCFSKFEDTDTANQKVLSPDESKLNDYIISKLPQILKSAVEDDDIKQIESILSCNFTVDWYKRESVISQIRMAIMGYYFTKTQNKKQSKAKAMQISNLLEKAIREFTFSIEREG